MDKQSNIRLILAVAISFVVLFVWSKYFVTQPEQDTKQKSQNVEQGIDKDKEAPQIASTQVTSMLDSNAPLSPKQDKKIISTISSKDFQVDIDSQGRISQVYLKDEKYTKSKDEGLLNHLGKLFGIGEKQSQSIDKLALFGAHEKTYPLEIRFNDAALNKKAFSTDYKASTPIVDIVDKAQILTLTQELDDLVVTKQITINPNLTYEVKITTSKKVGYVLSNGMRPVSEAENYAFNGVISKNTSNTIEKVEDGDAKKEGEIFPNSIFIASVDRYYATLLFSKNSFEAIVGSQDEMPMPFIKLEGDATLQGYVGPKDYEVLKSIDRSLVDVIEYGRITFFAKYIFMLLNFLYGYVNNWGVAIILLTLIIRIILYPLTYKGMIGMQKLKDLAPKMKELQEKYKDDKQKLQVAMMELYKKHGANPVGGCLPLILQIPVFFAIYRVLYNAVELKSADFILWIHDLSLMDPYFVLPIIMGITMYLQQSLTPSTFTDPMQQKIFKYLPVVFTIFLITFPAGLVLYWTINNIISIAQQLIINKILDNKKQAAIASKKVNK